MGGERWAVSGGRRGVKCGRWAAGGEIWAEEVMGSVVGRAGAPAAKRDGELGQRGLLVDEPVVGGLQQQHVPQHAQNVEQRGRVRHEAHEIEKRRGAARRREHQTRP